MAAVRWVSVARQNKLAALMVDRRVGQDLRDETALGRACAGSQPRLSLLVACRQSG